MEEIHLTGESAKDFDINEIMIDFLNVHLKKVKKTFKKEFERKSYSQKQHIQIKLTEAILFPSSIKNQISFFRKVFNTLSEDYRPENYSYKNIANELDFISLINSTYMNFYFFVIEFYRQLGDKIQEEMEIYFKTTCKKELNSLGINVYTDELLNSSDLKNDFEYFVDNNIEQILASFLNNFLLYLKDIQRGEKPICFYSFNFDNRYFGKILSFSVELSIKENFYRINHKTEINERVLDKDSIFSKFINHAAEKIREKQNKLLSENLFNKEYVQPKNIFSRNYFIDRTIFNLFSFLFKSQGMQFFKLQSEESLIISEYKEGNVLFKDFGSFSKNDIKELMILFSSLPSYKKREEILEIFK